MKEMGRWQKELISKKVKNSAGKIAMMLSAGLIFTAAASPFSENSLNQDSTPVPPIVDGNDENTSKIYCLKKLENTESKDLIIMVLPLMSNIDGFKSNILPTHTTSVVLFECK